LKWSPPVSVTVPGLRIVTPVGGELDPRLLARRPQPRLATARVGAPVGRDVQFVGPHSWTTRIASSTTWPRRTKSRPSIAFTAQRRWYLA
jgi:hypothetical protein